MSAMHEKAADRERWKRTLEELGMDEDTVVPPPPAAPVPPPPAAPLPIAQELSVIPAPPEQETLSEEEPHARRRRRVSPAPKAVEQESVSEAPRVLEDADAPQSEEPSSSEKSEGRKRRRRRRRKGERGDKPASTVPPSEGETGAEPVEAEVAEPVRPRAEGGLPRSGEGDRSRRRDHRRRDVPEPGPVEVDQMDVEPTREVEEDDSPLEGLENWNVPSWQDIIASLYKPDR